MPLQSEAAWGTVSVKACVPAGSGRVGSGGGYLEINCDDIRGGDPCSVQLDLILQAACILGCHRNELQPVGCCVVCLSTA